MEYKWSITKSRFFFLHHLKAFQYLCDSASLNENLTPETILKTHEILMSNSVKDNGKKIENGKIRTTSCHVIHIYPHPRALKSSLSTMVENYNCENGVVHPVQLATKLFFYFLKLHPFEDRKNGKNDKKEWQDYSL